MRELGEFLGTMIIISYGLALLSFLLKWLNKNFSKQINQMEWLKNRFPKVMKFFVKNHRFFGFAAVLFILLHFGIQFSLYGVSPTGALAAGLMILQVVVGLYGHKRARRSKLWLWMHRMIAVVIGIAILIHIN
ncbi:hypothetical protein [Fusibacter ferrireducens]|uniref:Cytochrome b561 domain-containing protein n=1 Tax=Fusibacter ferrireducens TaxID=2785058 RepID=A0ABR9ZXV7_9FIRM|nr:hypothetical protein [Fusibacter ferrireducens]MBF4695304.1 hypothetical protein [Fusibacter ferrireducens]